MKPEWNKEAFTNQFQFADSAINDSSIPRSLFTKADLLTRFASPKNPRTLFTMANLKSGNNNDSSQFMIPQGAFPHQNATGKKNIGKTSMDLSYALEEKQNMKDSYINDIGESLSLPQIGMVYKVTDKNLFSKNRKKCSLSLEKVMEKHMHTVYKSSDIMKDLKAIEQQDEDFKKRI